MKIRNEQTKPINFEDDPGFEVKARNAANGETKPIEAEFAELQEKLLETAFSHTETLSLYGAIRQASNEAAGLAWTTGFPLLVFPTLFDEKTKSFKQRGQRQERIMARTHALVEEISA